MSFWVDMPGGLGNQIYAYYCALYLHEKTSEKVFLQFGTRSMSHSETFDLRSFQLHLPQVKIANRVYEKLIYNLYYPEKNRLMRKLNRTLGSPLIHTFPPGHDCLENMDLFLEQTVRTPFPKRISGYFGDFRFYEHIKKLSVELKLVKPSNQFTSYVNEVEFRKSLAVHLRLGDYLNFPLDIGILSDKYYRDAISTALRFRNFDTLLVFTNDFELAKKRLLRWELSKPFTIIAPEQLVDPAESLKLMALCQGLIASNSTFSFWASKLAGPNTDIWVPRYWRIRDQAPILGLPEKWNVLENDWILAI